MCEGNANSSTRRFTSKPDDFKNGFWPTLKTDRMKHETRMDA